MTALCWIPLAPLFACLVLLLAGRRLGRASAWVAIGAMGCAAWQAAVVWQALARGVVPALAWTWVVAGAHPLSIGLRADHLSGVMLSVVTIIGTLIQVYSVGYMADDARFSRFFAYLSQIGRAHV